MGFLPMVTNGKPMEMNGKPLITISKTPLRTTQSNYEIPVIAHEADNNNHINTNNEIRDENGFTLPRGTPIQNFYAGQNIFITGGTGFLGKILIEKLLRSCPQISTIYLLIRKKKDKNMEDRIEDLFNNSLFDQLRKSTPKFRQKIVGILGDCSVRGLGLSSNDRERLLREVSIVFHSAATLRFDEKMDIAVAINVASTLTIMDLSKHMDRLKALIHVSTAYANCNLPRIEESFYSHATTYEDLQKLIERLSEGEIEKMTPKILGDWPNTYTFTKALAELVIKEKNNGLCMGIFRPAAVISTAYEPVPGWIDNMNGPTGTITAIASGILRSLELSPTSKANVVPADCTVNALIASAWDVANQFDRRGDKMLIYNYVSTTESSITWEQYCRTNMVHAKEFPLSSAKWAVTLFTPHNKTMSLLGRMFLHYLPAIFVDSIRICLGYQPKLVKTYRKIDKFVEVLRRFRVNNWIFTNTNVVSLWQRLDEKDRQIFRFSIKDLDWNNYFRNHMKGIRIYLLKDNLNNLEASRKRAQRYTWLHEIIKILMLTLLSWTLWKIVAAIFF